jgi:hypothetical protein
MSGIIAAAGITAAATVGSTLMSKSMGGGGGGAGAGQQMQQTNSQLPGWVNSAAMQNYGDATRASYDMPGPYTGQRVADMTPEMQNLIGQLYGNVGQTNWAFDRAGALTNGLTGFNPSMVSPQTLAGTDLSPYMNPYSSMVINPAMTQMEQARRQALGQVGDQATQSRAFGGSRQGIAEGVTNAQSELQKGQFVGNLMGQNFAQAQAGATGDITRNMQAQQLNQAAGEWGAGFQGQMAQQLAGLAQGRQQNYLAGIQPAMAGQQMMTAQDQAKLDAAQQLYNEQKQDPLQRIAIRTNQLSQSPYGQETTQTGPGPSTNPMLTGLGVGATTAGLLGTFGKMGGFNAANYPDWLTGRVNGIPTVQSEGYSPMSIGGMPQSYYTGGA